MQKSDKKIKTKNKNSAQKGVLRKYSRLLFMPLLVVAFSVAVVYATVVVGRLTNEVSYELKLPDNIVRLQVLNASSDAGAMRELCQFLSEYKSDQVEFMVVDSSKVNRLSVSETIVISREADLTAAVLTSELVGCDPSLLKFKPLEFNTDLVTVSIVIGDDIDMQQINDNIIKEDR
ncbi:MAG: LytR C-terminal domain-containing protein [bacterium]|nr:LytR C-terminal domain-containing protein [bacterium]